MVICRQCGRFYAEGPCPWCSNPYLMDMGPLREMRRREFEGEAKRRKPDESRYDGRGMHGLRSAP